jgi:hypothetical protein
MISTFVCFKTRKSVSLSHCCFELNPASIALSIELPDAKRQHLHLLVIRNMNIVGDMNEEIIMNGQWVQ